MLAGDSKPWRDLGYVKWYDPLAILENTKSQEFHDAVADETYRWTHASRKDKQHWAKDYKSILSAALPPSPDCVDEQFTWQGYTIKVQNGFSHRKHIWFLDSSNIIVHSLFGLTDVGMDPDSDMFYTIKDAGHGGEVLQLDIYKAGRSTSLWHKQPVGPSAIFTKDHVYYQTVENHLRYPGVVRVTKASGKLPTTIFHEHDPKYQVDIFQPYNQTHIFIKTANALDQRLGYIVGSSVRWLTPKSPKDANGSGTSLFPIDIHFWAINNALIINDHTYKLPDHQSIMGVIYSSDKSQIYLSTVHNASTSIYAFDLKTKKYKSIYTHKGPNNITLLPDNKVKLMFPYTSSVIGRIAPTGVYEEYKFPEPLVLPVHTFGLALSRDKTRVPFSYVSAVKKPIGLIVDGYGSYGISSTRAYPIRWLPWLARGYAYVMCCPRGGRENGDEWYDGGRSAVRKHNTFDDVAAIIHTVQQHMKISPNHTIFYGRSAGGLLAANIAHTYPNLVGAIYTEVPYVDVLRTTTNPDLPLTQMEYDEFGNPAVRPMEYEALQRISPVDTVPIAPKDAPLIVVRTAINDAQVLPYEALKWAKKLRANGWTVYVGIDGGGRHFAEEADMYTQEAEDAALIHANF